MAHSRKNHLLQLYRGWCRGVIVRERVFSQIPGLVRGAEQATCMCRQPTPTNPNLRHKTKVRVPLIIEILHDAQ